MIKCSRCDDKGEYYIQVPALFGEELLLRKCEKCNAPKIELKQINEDMKLHEEWYKQAKECTIDSLSGFINNLMNKYKHDYGTICHAIAASALAAAHAVDKHKQGGITNFQAGHVMWQFIRQYMHFEGHLKMANFDDMLHPQNSYKFEKEISSDIYNYLQKKAKEKILKNESTSFKAHPAVLQHWQSIVDGHVPFGYSIKE